MKKMILVLSVASLFVACTKESKKDKNENEKENHCPVVSASAVPASVVSAFQTKYPGISVNTWFQKDNIGYCAYFIQPPNQKKLAEFTTAGVFVSEELDTDHDGNFEDSTGTTGTKSTTACECEIPD